MGAAGETIGYSGITSVSLTQNDLRAARGGFTLSLFFARGDKKEKPGFVFSESENAPFPRWFPNAFIEERNTARQKDLKIKTEKSDSASAVAHGVFCSSANASAVPSVVQGRVRYLCGHLNGGWRCVGLSW